MARTYLGHTQTAANADLDALASGTASAGWVQAGAGTVARTISAKLRDVVSVTDFGAVGTASQADSTTNTTAFRAAFAAGALARKNVYIPSGTYVVDDNFTFTSLHNGMSVYGDGPSSCIKLANSPNSGNVEAGWMFLLDGTALAPLRSLRITGLRLDGSKDTTTWSDSSYGIVGYTDAVLENCVVDSCWAHDFRTSGFNTFAGGIRFTNDESYNNTAHGLGVSVDNTFTGVCEVYQFRAHGNGGYGLDAGRGCRTFVRGVEAYENTQGGIKYSIGTVLLDIDGVHVYNNGTAGVSGPGFTDTDTTGNGIILIGSVVTHDNAGPGFRATSANTLDIRRVVSYDNDCYVASSVAAYDILIGATSLLDYFSAGYLRSDNAPSHGILIDGSTIKAYSIDTVEVVGAQDGGFVDNTTGPVNATIGQIVLRDNNKAGTVGASGAAAQLESTNSTFNIGSLVCRDDQGVPTQTGGLYASLGATVKIGAATFGTGITTPYFSASSGTTINVGNGYGAIRTVTSTPASALDFGDETILCDATGGVITIALKAVVNMAGKVYRIKKIDASGNAITINPNSAELIDGAATYALAAQWDSAVIQCDGAAWYVVGIGP